MKVTKLRVDWGATVAVGDRHSPIRPYFGVEVELGPGDDPNVVAENVQRFVQWHWHHNVAVLVNRQADVATDCVAALERFFVENPTPADLAVVARNAEEGRAE